VVDKETNELRRRSNISGLIPFTQDRCVAVIEGGSDE
jgi:hypothetical protein